MSDQTRLDAINALKSSILQFLGTNGRHYGDLSRMEQSVEDLAQALNTRLDQLVMVYQGALPSEVGSDDPRHRLANRMLHTAQGLVQRGHVDAGTADAFERTLELLDISADLHRQAETAKDAGETAAITYKRGRV